eukprot:COSAG03_NODE_1311_length_4344_cov_180.266667_2_plen_43_part_00
MSSAGRDELEHPASARSEPLTTASLSQLSLAPALQREGSGAW